MQIGEVAERTSLTVDAIRFYEKRKLLLKAVRTQVDSVCTEENTVARLHFIQQVQELGFSLLWCGSQSCLVYSVLELARSLGAAE
jgi:DNA-binding transcriptional MerR regulator